MKKDPKLIVGLTAAAGLLAVTAAVLARKAMKRTVDDIIEELDEEEGLVPEEAAAPSDFVDAEGTAEDVSAAASEE